VGLSYGQLQWLLRCHPSRDPQDPNFRRHCYLRHGSTLLLGLAAPAGLARFWSRRLVQQLQQHCGLLSPPPPLRASTAPLFFRGFRLRSAARGSVVSPPTVGSGGFRAGEAGEACRHHPRPEGHPRLSLKLPSAKLAALLGRAGLLHWGGRQHRQGYWESFGSAPAFPPQPLKRSAGWRPTAAAGLLRHSSEALILIFGRVLATLAAYYRGVDNPAELLTLLQRLRGTLLRSLGRRHRCSGLQLELRWEQLRWRGRRRLPPLPPPVTPEQLRSPRPVALHGRRWQESRQGLSLDPLQQLLALMGRVRPAPSARHWPQLFSASSLSPPPTFRPPLAALRRPAREKPDLSPRRRPGADGRRLPQPTFTLFSFFCFFFLLFFQPISAVVESRMRFAALVRFGKRRCL
jgi:hypothetical protein